MSRDLIQLSVRKPVIKVLLILLLIVAGTWSHYVLRWYLGNTLAEYFNTGESNVDVARMATSLAPNDPLPHWRVAQVSQKTLSLDQQAQAIAEYEKAVSLSPNDYRFWMALGTAHEQSGDAAKGEQALKRAVALAPSYAYPHWYLGNLLLRNGRYDEAFAELRVASDADPELRPQQFSLLWEIYGNDFEALKGGVGQSAPARAQFALYLIAQKRFDDGLRLWESISAEDKKANSATCDSIVASLINALRYHDALKVWNDIVPNNSYRAEVGRIFDGGFEEAVNYGPETVFGWQVMSAPQVQIGIDPAQGRTGARSLRLLFQIRSNLDLVPASQLVPVLADTEYDFECYVKTEKLESGSTPLIQIVDATNRAVLVASQPAPNGDNGWNRIGLSFKTGGKTEAVTLKIVRASCSSEETSICPIFGAVWYDDFSFKRRG